MQSPSKANINISGNDPLDGILKTTTDPSNWRFTESSLIQAIILKKEQERTKQEYYRVESLNRTLEILRLACHARIPPHMIPTLISGNTVAATQSSVADATGSSAVKLSPKGDEVARSQYKFGNSSQVAMPRGPNLGAVPLRDVPNHQRKLSPARVGRDAVASLGVNDPGRANGIHPRQDVSHQKASSLPPKVSIPELSTVDFHNQENLRKKLINSNGKEQGMVSTHQLIQFHHWTPDKDTESEITPNKRRRSSLVFESPDSTMAERDEYSFLGETPSKGIPSVPRTSSLHPKKFNRQHHTRTRSDTSIIRQIKQEEKGENFSNADGISPDGTSTRSSSISTTASSLNFPPTTKGTNNRPTPRFPNNILSGT
ncbi:BA75_03252T0 [Komagataella pastoris]|uniref:BA75_03252T0 n=1 Tax=Komagataella pastoris TaxID=4922 RepID=A0A1B2JA49_PICPA|nr:BA75_03252T0 [Komagataella pastoris]